MSFNNFEKFYGVQLGCFNQPAKNWYNTDITPHIFISKIYGLPHLLKMLNVLSSERYDEHKRKVFNNVHYLNLLKKLPFGDNSINAYFSSHVLEHLPISKSRQLLKEIFRTLKQNGFIRFVLPDLEYAISIYNKKNPEPFLNMVFENQNKYLLKNQHKWMFTFPYMMDLLKEAGFEKIWKFEFKQTNYPPFLELDNRPENSFYIEAQK